MRNNKLKLILCLILSLAMLVSVACVTAMASDSPYDDEPESPDRPDVPEDHTHSYSVWLPIPGSVDKHVRHCECGMTEHQPCSYDSGAVTTRPTYESDGVRTLTCQICHGTKTEKINKLNPGEPDPYAEEESKAWIIPVVIAIVAALGTVACGVIIIKKNSTEKKETDKADSSDDKKGKAKENE